MKNIFLIKPFFLAQTTTLKLGLTLALTLVLTNGCSSEMKNTQKGTAIGAGAGAVAGAIIGNQSGNNKKGALLGGVLGGAAGSIIGNRLDKQAKELDRIAETKRTEDGLVTKLKSDILFETGKAELKPEATANLQQMATIMKKYPENVVTIKGYTDATGSDQTNQALSKRRATAVKAVLVANELPAATISTEGLGEDSPIADNTTPSGRQQNRRVEIEVAADATKIPDQVPGKVTR